MRTGSKFKRSYDKNYDKILLKEIKSAYLTSNQLQANVETKFINEIQGYSQGNIDLDRYGKNYDAEILYENCTKKIVYESSRGRKIDFSGLKVDWKKIF